jgi:hypothetical protein
MQPLLFLLLRLFAIDTIDLRIPASTGVSALGAL